MTEERKTTLPDAALTITLTAAYFGRFLVENPLCSVPIDSIRRFANDESEKMLSFAVAYEAPENPEAASLSSTPPHPG